jgi:hypothetical protein
MRKWAASSNSIRHSAAFRSFQVLSGPFRFFQVLSGPFRSFQVLSGPFRSFQVLSGPFRSFQVLSGPFRSFQLLNLADAADAAFHLSIRFFLLKPPIKLLLSTCCSESGSNSDQVLSFFLKKKMSCNRIRMLL